MDAGGAAAFARATGVTLRTAEAWLYGEREHPNPKLAGLLADALYHRRYCSEATQKDKKVALLLREMRAMIGQFIPDGNERELFLALTETVADHLDPTGKVAKAEGGPT